MTPVCSQIRTLVPFETRMTFATLGVGRPVRVIEYNWPKAVANKMAPHAIANPAVLPATEYDSTSETLIVFSSTGHVKPWKPGPHRAFAAGRSSPPLLQNPENP